MKEILGWISDEAGKFSKEVTTWGGEKGVADHMDTCKVLSLSLSDSILLAGCFIDAAKDIARQETKSGRSGQDGRRVDSRRYSKTKWNQ